MVRQELSCFIFLLRGHAPPNNSNKEHAADTQNNDDKQHQHFTVLQITTLSYGGGHLGHLHARYTRERVPRAVS